MPVVYTDKTKRLQGMKLDRQSWDQHYRELQEFFLPRRSRWIEAPASMRGQKMNQKLVDPSPRLAARALAAGMHSGSTNPAMPWFKLTTPDTEMMEFPAVANWLYIVEQVIRGVFERSNVYSVLPSLYGDAGVFGTAPMTVLEHDTRVIHCVPSAVGSYYLSTSYDGVVDTKYCEYKMTASQMIAEFGEKKVSEQVLSAAKSQNVSQYFDVLHVIEPNTGRKWDDYSSQSMAWRSCYLELSNASDQRVLRESGFEDNPIAALRWEVTEITDPYGASPGMDALGCAKAIQVQQKQKAKAIDKLVDPPMVGDPSMQKQPSTLIPGGVTWHGFTQTGGAPKFQPAYQIRPDLSGMLADIVDLRELVDEAMYKDLFLAITIADPRNATVPEIVERREEKILMLGPVLQNHRDGLLKPLIDRTFYICMRRGMLPPPPPELEGVDLRVEMIGLLAQALRAVNSSGIERFVGFAGTLAQAQANAGESPTVLDKVDFDQAMDEYGLALGVPPTVIRSDDKVEVIRKGRAQQQAAQQAAAAAQPIQQIAGAAKDLSETKVGGTTALDAMVGQ